MKKLIFGLLCLLLAIPSYADIITVDDDLPADFNNIQAAIDDANDSDVIVVLPGTYTGDGNRDISFNGKAITVRSFDPTNPAVVAATVIDCNQEGWGFNFSNNEDANSVLAGLTITNGTASGDGVIYINNSGPTINNCIITNNLGSGVYYQGNRWEPIGPTIANCTISGNSGWGRIGSGGGITVFDGICTINNCIIENNSVNDKGGGIYSRDADVTLTNCLFSGNSASNDGGGICSIYELFGGDLTMTNCMVTGNSAGVNGGGIYVDTPSHDIKITNSIFSGNSANSGGAIYTDSSSTWATTNCTISGNSATNQCGGIFSDNAVLYMTDCILWGNTDSNGTDEFSQLQGGTPLVVYSCIQDDNPNDTNIPFGDPNNYNIDDNPLFVRDPNDGGDGWGIGGNDDFGNLHLQVDSPCINTGMPNFVAGTDSRDIDNQPRIMGSRVDMGADEYAPIIMVTKPQGGETWAGTSIHPIMWEGFGVSNVDILFSPNNGTNWFNIANDFPNTGAFPFAIPNTIDSNQCVISVIPGTPDPNVITIESGLFAIKPFSLNPVVPPLPSWPSLSGNFKRSGLSLNSGPQTGCVKWKFETDGAVTTGVTVRDFGPPAVSNILHIACEDGKLYTLDAEDGSLLWSFDTNSPLLSSPTVDIFGTVYAGSQDGKLYAIDRDGQLRWTHTTGGAIYSSPAVSAEGKIYVCSQDGLLYALAINGTKMWSFETAGFGSLKGSIMASPAVGADGTIYIGGLYDPNLYALEPSDGSIKWACNFEPNNWPFASPVIGTDGAIYQALVYDSNLYAIDPNTGNINWSIDLTDTNLGWLDSNYPGKYPHADGFSEPVLGPDGTIYVSLDEDPYIRAVNPDGTAKWSAKLGETTGFTLTVGSDGLIYAAGDSAHYTEPLSGERPIYIIEDKPGVYVIDQNGSLISQLEAPTWPSFPVITTDNTLIISDVNNTVWAIKGDNCENQEFVLHWPEDISNDGAVNFFDLILLTDEWLGCTDIGPPCDYYETEMENVHWEQKYLKADIDKSRYVNFNDFTALANRWLNEN